MTITTRDTLSSNEKDFVLRLWNNEYPERLAHSTMESLENYLDGLENPVYFIADDNHGTPVAWAALFDREGGRWFAMIIDSSAQRMGLGKKFLNNLKERETSLSAWAVDHTRDFKANGSPYLPSLSFYLKNGFEICEGQRLESDKLSAIKITWKQTSPVQQP